jgi:hypothetical protein
MYWADHFHIVEALEETQHGTADGFHRWALTLTSVDSEQDVALAARRKYSLQLLCEMVIAASNIE